MAASLAQLAKRAFVSLLLALAQQYRVRVTLSRDSADHVVEAAFRSVVKKVHPDKGGAVGDAQRLQQAREEWKGAKAKGPRPGRRPVTVAAAVLTAGERETQSRKSFRIRSSAVLLTYHGIALGAWKAFLAFVRSHLAKWGVEKWCASMERCISGDPHVHLMLQFHSASDTRVVDSFSFRRSRPNASSRMYVVKVFLGSTCNGQSTVACSMFLPTR